MSRYRRSLRNSVSAEARAFGFSVVLLASAYLCVGAHGLPGTGGTLAYAGGVLAAQLATAALAFGGTHETWSTGEDVRYRAYGAVHLVSVSLAILLAWGVASLVGAHTAAFAATGFAAIAAYQLLLAVELALAMVR
jgi:hypothetical protein